ncbi:DUF6266 family protein [Pedobacter sp. FW305-3-2-15-E-R2A2]|uniref:DUF6266 family protein n=1 Tax=Pedobacter sp. FW305-3-2-15-E-R2A2 TaxID=3140251 RepID=UPI00314023E8
MARITKGLLGGFSGKIGAVVGYTLYGIDRMRSLPDRTAPPTENELKNRSQFKLVQDTLQSLKELLQVGFKNYWTVSGGTRAALSYNRKFAVQANETGYEIDPKHFKISGGNLPGLTGLSVVQESAAVLRFHWNPEDVPESSGYDQVMLLAIDLKGQQSSYECPGNFRSAGTAMLRISKDLLGKEVDVYIGVVAKDRSAQSHSQYLGRIQLQDGEPVLNTETEAKATVPELMEEDKIQRPGGDDRQEAHWKTEFNLGEHAMIKALKTLVEAKPPEGSPEIWARLLNRNALFTPFSEGSLSDFFKRFLSKDDFLKIVENYMEERKTDKQP